MTGFLETLGNKVADHWLNLVVPPGVLWVATVLVASRMGWRHALDLPALGRDIDEWTRTAHSPGVLVLLVVGLLLASAAAGLAATGLGTLTRRLWMIRGRQRPAQWLVRSRQKRWRTADEIAISLMRESIRTATQADNDVPTEPQAVVSGPGIAEALARREAISLEFPDRPTWIGDRWRATTIRVHRAYGLDMTVAWPRLWSVLPEPLRADITAAQSHYTTASTMIGWAALYGVLSIWWWPALLIGTVVLTAGTLRARTATTTLCQLVETAADLHSHTLAEQLRIPCSGPLSIDTGNDINSLLRKDPLVS